MLFQQVLHGSFVPGYQIAAAVGLQRGYDHHRAGRKVQHAPRRAADEQAPHPLPKVIPAAPDDNAVNVHLSCRLHNFVGRYPNAQQHLQVLRCNPSLQ
jgi:hypothetical protein